MIPVFVRDGEILRPTLFEASVSIMHPMVYILSASGYLTNPGGHLVQWHSQYANAVEDYPDYTGGGVK